MAVKGTIIRQFHDAAQVHDRNPVADVPDYTQIMGNKEVREVELPL
jgi:hypothetical protein